MTDFDALGAEIDQAVTTTSADGLTVLISRDADGDGVVGQTDTTVFSTDGSNVETITDFDANGVETDQTTITASADGLRKTTQWDYQGDGTIDRTRSDVIAVNADGSRTETLTDVNSDGTPHSLSVQTTSADGRTRILQTDSDGSGTFDHTEVTTVNIDGSSTIVAKDFNSSGTLVDTATSTVSADQHQKTVQVQVPTGQVVHSEVTQTNIDGSVTTSAADLNFKGTVLDRSVATLSADGLFRTVDTDSKNAGFFDKAETVQTRIDGSKVITDETLNSAGTVTGETITILSADGQVTTTDTPPTGVAFGGFEGSTEVVQGASNGTEIGNAAGLDADPHAAFRYSLVDDAGGRFAIDPIAGTVTVANSLLLFQGTTEQITIRAVDENGIAVEQSFGVAVVPPAAPPVASFQSFFDADGVLLSQTGINAGGSSWTNVYDPSGANGFTSFTNAFDGAGNLLSHSQANVDGTHTLTAFDTTNTHGWATFTILFDPSFIILSITGTNHAGGTTIDPGEVENSLDTITWFPTPLVFDTPTLSVQDASGNAGTAIALEIDSGTRDPLRPPSVLISGVPSAATLSAGTRNADGTWTLTRAQLVDLTMLVPAGGFAGTASLTVTSSEADPGVQHAFTSQQLTVQIAGVAAPPALSFGVGSGVLTAPIPLAITSALTATDGLETLSTVVTGMPAAATLMHGTNIAGTKNADGSWTLAQSDLSDLTLVLPPGSFTGSATLTVTATAQEPDGSQAATSAQLVIGDAGSNTLSGGNANTVFIGGGGNDTITGGTGRNAAVYTGNMGDYAVTRAPSGTYTVSDQRVGGTDGVDTVSGVLSFQFADATEQFNAAGQLLSVTLVDRNDMAGWSTFETDYDAAGNVVSQTGINDGGSSWVNVYDPTGTQNFISYTDYRDVSGAVVSHTQANRDGTHTLVVNDTANTQSWATFTIQFDTDFNQVSVTGVNDDGTTTVDVPGIEVSLDTLIWFAHPFVVQPPTATGGDLPVLTVQNAAGNAGTPIALSIGSSLTSNDAGDTLSIKITGVPRGATLSAGHENADGSWSLSPGQLNGLTLTAPAGTFAGTANLTVVATATEPTGLQVSNSANLAVAIAGVATAPTLVVHNVSGNAGTAIALNTTSLLTASDGTETLAVRITGVPALATLSAGTRNADGSWSLTGAQLNGLSLSVPAGAFSGVVNLTTTATATETDGSQAAILASSTVTVVVAASAPSLSVTAASGAAGDAIALSIASALTATDGTETLSIRITGVPPTATLSAGTRNADGSWSLTPAQLANLSLTTPAGSFAGTANLGVVATATETNGSAASTTANLPVAIAGVATPPTLSATGASGNAGQAIPLSITSALTATDGTETLSIKITGVPSFGSLSAGTRNADGSWTVTAAQLAALKLTVPAGSFAGTDSLSIVATATETDGSQASSAPVNIAVAIAGVATAPTLSVHDTSGATGAAIPLAIASALTATDGTETLSIKVTGVPAGASLSAGTHNADGSWSLTPAQLTNLNLTVPSGGFVGTAHLAVVATATETDGSSAPASANMAVTVIAPPTRSASAGAPISGDLTFKSLSFNGASHQTVTQVDAFPSDPTRLTIAMWFKLGANGQLMGLVSTTNSAINNESFYIDATGHLVFNHRVNNQNVTFTSSLAVTDLNWHQVVFSGDVNPPPGGTQMQISLDGVQDTAVTKAGTAAFTSFLMNSGTGNNPAIGVSSQTQGSANFTGKIADFYFIDGEPQTPASSFVAGSGAGTTYATAYPGGFDAAGSWLTFANAASAATLGFDDAGGLPGAHAGANSWTLNNGPVSSTDGPPVATVIPWNISAALVDPASETLSLKVTGMPAGGTLSAGTRNADGSWSLTPAQLTGLTVTLPPGPVTTLTAVTATASATGGGQANTAAQLVIGSSGNDTLTGGGGIVSLVGGAGNDAITGTAQDTVAYAGNFSDYAISFSSVTHAFTVRDTRVGTPDGTDTVAGVSSFRFADSTAQYDTAGTLRTQTIYDSRDVVGWSSFQTSYDALGNVLTQVGINDGGSSWSNVYDAANQFSWSYYTNYSDANGNLVSHTQTNDDGTHSLTAFDTTNSYSWANFTINFDANWNWLSVIGVNHNGTTNIDMGQVSTALDTLTWYSSPFVVTPPPSGGFGSGGGDGLPVLLGLNGNGIDVVPLGNSSAQFDMTGSGTPVPTAWAGGGDGILAIDIGAGNSPTGGTGVIDQAKQIEFTQWAPGTTSDMAALEQVFDTNHNEMLDAGDALWNDFRVWVGSEGVGTGQVFSLTQLGITSIGLAPTGPAQQLSDGSVIQGLSTFTMADGTAGVAGDVALAFGSSASPGNAGAEPIMLSNGTSADAGVAQLVSALAATGSAGDKAFGASVMSTPNDGSAQPVVAAALHPS